MSSNVFISNQSVDKIQPSSPSKKIMKNEVSVSPKSDLPTSIFTMTPTSAILDREARALNIALESSLLITLRQDVSLDKTICYMGSNQQTGDLLTTANISELICSRLMGRNEILNAVNYLSGCYKRILSKEVAAAQKLRDDLIK